MKTQDRLEIGLGNDSNLVEQYKIKYGEKCKYIPLKEKDVWICTCGTINHSDEKKCCNCNNDAQTIFSVNLDELKAECNERIAQENKEKKREIQTEIVFVIGICICIVCVLCFLAKIN